MSTTTGCIQKRCPCRLWINCGYYNEHKHRTDRREIAADIRYWYDTSFRIEYRMEKCPTGELMMLDRLDLLHTMVARQLQTIETGYVRATCSKEMMWR